MHRTIRSLAVPTIVALLGPGTAAGQDTPQLTTEEAAAHVGAHATVCGLVVSTRYAERSRGRPTFLNFDRPFPNQPFTVVIWGDDRARFPAPPERAYRDKRVCAKGTIEEYRGVPQIVARSAEALRVVEETDGGGRRGSRLKSRLN